MTYQPPKFVYSAKEIPPYGEPGQVLVKAAAAFYYTTWDNLDNILNTTDGIIDEGEYL